MSMTVKKLIEELQKCDPNALIETSQWEDSGCSCGYEVRQELDYISPGTVVELSFSQK